MTIKQDFTSDDSSEDELQQSKLAMRLPESVPTLSNEFMLRDVFQLQSQNEKLISVCFNSRQKMFVFIDKHGILSWKWNSSGVKIVRHMALNLKQLSTLLYITYCGLYNCYFVLDQSNSILVINRDFEEIYRTPPEPSTILCMIYNPLSDELIISSVDGVKVWRLEKFDSERWKSQKKMSNYKLVFKRKLNLCKDWIRKIDIDTLNCHLYCCTTRDLYIYDFNGNLMRHFKEVHPMAITSCVYSPTARVVVTGSLDSEIKVWSLDGGLLEVLRGHSRPITNLVLNPYNSNLVLSSSLDGIIRMWSLDIMQSIYQLNLVYGEIFWMGFTEEKLLYLATPFTVFLYKLNNFIDYWASTSYKIKDIKMCYSANKSTRLVTISEENTISIFNRQKGNQLTIVLPIPDVHNASQFTSIAYCRNTNSIYIFIDNKDIWFYFTKTNPANLVSVWNVTELQEDQTENQGGYRKRPNEQAVMNVLKKHRAIEYGLTYLSTKQKHICRCIGILESEVEYWNTDGKCLLNVKSFLLLGLENGTVLFCDPLIQGKKYFILNCCKDPVIDISHDKLNNCLVTKIEMTHLYRIQFWSLPHLTITHEVFCPKDITSYARLGLSILFGYEDGALDLDYLQPIRVEESANRMLNEQETESIIEKPRRYEHKERIQVIDSCIGMQLFSSCSLDGCIKIWRSNRQLLAEIDLDNTLSYCCFLNSFGDLIVGWKSHLFYIAIKKILPQLKRSREYFDDSDVDLDLFDRSLDDSFVIEDPFLDTENLDDLKRDLNLEKYLKPFELVYGKDGRLNVKLLPKMKNRAVTSQTESHFNDVFEDSRQSIVSSLPNSFLSTPRENPLHDLEKVDMTLSAKLDHQEIKNVLVELITDSIISPRSHTDKEFPKTWDQFPKFGKSPVSSPSRTPVPKTTQTPPPVIFEVPKHVVVERKTIPPAPTTPQSIKKPKSSDADSKAEIEMKKRMPPKFERLKLNQISINSKQLMNTVAARKKSIRPQLSRQSSLASSSKIKIAPPRTIKKRTVIKRLPDHDNEALKSVTNNSERPDANKSFTSLIEPNEKAQMEKDAVDSLIKLSESQSNKLSKGIQSSSNVSFSIEKRTSEAFNSSIMSSNNKISPRQEASKKAQQPAKTSHSNKALQSSPKPPLSIEKANSSSLLNQTKSEQSSGQVSQARTKNQKTEQSKKEGKSVAKSKQTHLSPDSKSLTSKVNKSALLRRLSRGSMDSKSSADPRSFVQTVTDVYSGEDESSPGPPPSSGRRPPERPQRSKTDVSEFSSGKTSISDEPSTEMKALTSSQQLEMVDLNAAYPREAPVPLTPVEKSKKYFEYLYSMNGHSGLPKRVSSGAYVVTFDNKDGQAKTNQRSQQSGARSALRRYDIEESTLLNMDEKSSDWNNVDNQHFYQWLRNYEVQKSKLRDRLLSAKINNEEKTYENLKRWSSSIEKKNLIRKPSGQALNRPVLPFSPSPVMTMAGGGPKLGSTNPYESSSLNYDSNGEMGAKEIDKILLNKPPDREIKSATITPRKSKLNVRGRPKSVSFFIDKQLNEEQIKQLISQRQETVDAGAGQPDEQAHEALEDAALQNLIVQPSYLISQIEMEEIMQEVEKRVKSASEANKYSRLDSQDLSDDESESELDQDKWKPRQTRKRSFSPAKTNSSPSGGLHRQSTMGSILRSTNASSMATASRQQKYPKTSTSNKDDYHTAHRLSLRNVSVSPSSKASYKLHQMFESEDSEGNEEKSNDREEPSDAETSGPKSGLNSNHDSSMRHYGSRLQHSRAFNARKSSGKPVRFIAERSHTPSSIPHMGRSYQLVNYPVINLEYQIPNCPERYLLPIRFPKLYKRIVSSLVKFKETESYKPLFMRSKAY